MTTNFSASSGLKEGKEGNPDRDIILIAGHILNVIRYTLSDVNVTELINIRFLKYFYKPLFC